MAKSETMGLGWMRGGEDKDSERHRHRERKAVTCSGLGALEQEIAEASNNRGEIPGVVHAAIPLRGRG